MYFLKSNEILHLISDYYYYRAEQSLITLGYKSPPSLHPYIDPEPSHHLTAWGVEKSRSSCSCSELQHCNLSSLQVSEILTCAWYCRLRASLSCCRAWMLSSRSSSFSEGPEDWDATWLCCSWDINAKGQMEKWTIGIISKLVPSEKHQ